MSTSGAHGLKNWIKAHWATLRKILIACFLIVVVGLLSFAIIKVDWNEVLDAIYNLPSRALWTAGFITAISYIVYSSFDVLGKWYTEHALAWWRSMMVGFISYAFALSLGAPVGGVGLRVRLYSKQGLPQGVIMRILGLSLTTNWIGYSLLAGFLFASGIVALPESWKLNDGPLRIMGAIMVLAGIFYLGLCAFSRTRSWLIFGHTIELPSFSLAIIQVPLAILNWALMGAVIYVLFQQKIPYQMVLATLLISAIAGALAHIPGGLGVTESVFIALLAGDSMGQGEMLAALLAYRAIYFLGPLLLAAAWYLGAEAKMDHPAKKASRRQAEH
ncbi:UPF0104 family protein [Candidimonas sp. SYP-B2681]|uniref:lysylphosphatidylglycerol synthase domain-containing protein n=1 Tax=Candidimonas sp. SYP-B2681 TaxID=2497686 RepID=UPI000F85C4F3|nr:lysylphosphatidylglycerol synthase domain-containing protein [Candidimonas sp. SYP-B2681]RTZ47913.1 UPF0104 family protein [Candidimonas sp. SYP-B2681]